VERGGLLLFLVVCFKQHLNHTVDLTILYRSDSQVAFYKSCVNYCSSWCRRFAFKVTGGKTNFKYEILKLQCPEFLRYLACGISLWSSKVLYLRLIGFHMVVLKEVHLGYMNLYRKKYLNLRYLTFNVVFTVTLESSLSCPMSK
jgi:hypothetical protein